VTLRRLAGGVLRRLGWMRSGTRPPPRIRASDRLRDVPTRVTVRDDRTLMVNGQPFFPNGLYYARDEIADTSGDSLRALHDMGFNCVFVDGDIESARDLDRIHRAGLYVWCRPPGRLSGQFDQLKAFVARFGPHPALLFWEMDDEPVLNHVSLEESKKGCELVRAIDPFHPILCNQWFSTLAEEQDMREWGRLADVYGFSCYPVPTTRWGSRMQLVESGWPHSIAVVGRQTESWHSYAPGKPILPVLQAWAWNCIEDGDAAYPSLHEARFMVYHAVISGANGLHHYGAVNPMRPNLACGIPPVLHEDLDRTHADFERARWHNRIFWTYYSAVVGEIARMSAVFTARDSDWRPEGLPPSIECRVKRHEGANVLLVVNASAAPVALQLPAIADEVIEPLGVRVYSGGPE